MEKTGSETTAVTQNQLKGEPRDQNEAPNQPNTPEEEHILTDPEEIEKRVQSLLHQQIHGVFTSQDDYVFKGELKVIPEADYHFPDKPLNGTLIVLQDTPIDLKKYKFIKHGAGEIIAGDNWRIIRATWKDNLLEGRVEVTFDNKPKNRVSVYQCTNGLITDPSKKAFTQKLDNNNFFYKFEEREYTGGLFEILLHGDGHICLGDGIEYRGKFKFDKMHGKGKMSFPGGYYHGDFREDNMHGTGVMKTKDGLIYRGEFRNNCFEGNGQLQLANGGVYVGGFKANQMNGHGTLTTRLNAVYKGLFKDNSLDGMARIEYPDGSHYEGMVEKVTRTGFGKMVFVDGSRLEGVWRNNCFVGMPVGFGLLMSYAMFSYIFV